MHLNLCSRRKKQTAFSGQNKKWFNGVYIFLFHSENDKAVQSTPEKTRWLLKDPPARPDFVAPLNPPSIPAHHVTTITKVTVPASNCEQGSKFCLIL